MFKLLRYFSVTSAIALVVVTVALVILYRQSAVSEMVNMAESQNAALARSFANTIWPRFADYVRTVTGDRPALRGRSETHEIHAALKALTAGLPVLKVKIYNLQGLTVFSSEATQIGENKRNNPGFFRAASEGSSASKLSYRDTFSAFEGKVQNRDLVESYLPIWGQDGGIEAVFELYSDVTPLMGRIQRTTNQLVVSAVLAFAFLYTVLFLIVGRADRTIKRQYQALASSEERIKAQNDELTHEIDEHKRSEETLRKLSRAVEHSPAVTIVTDVAGAIEYVNPRFTEVTGYGLEEVAGKNPRVLQSGETAASLYEELWATITSGDEWRGELKNRKKSGEEYWAASSISPIKNPQGEITHFVSISEDVTERRRAHEALQAAKQDAEGANLAKSKFFAAASHDLRQPLHTMSLYLPLLSKRITDPECRDLVDAIEASCDSMGELLSALLDISKLDAGVVTPRIGPIATLPLFRKLEREFTLQAEAKGIELRVVPIARTISTDPGLLERILRNLLSNAIRHTSRGRVLIGARRRGSGLRIEIWDSGVGIEAGELAMIFQEFYQIGNPERDRNQGLGLGLAIVERLARLLGHRIDVASRPGCGSVFSVEVPTISARARARGADADSESCRHDLTGKLVVVIDDDARVLEGTTRTLQDWGCRVIGAGTIGSALAKIGDEQQPPDLILADFRLRDEETGLMAIELINRVVGGDTPAVIITGDTDPQRLREASESGYALLHKPVRVETLRAIVESELVG
jgi:PAS domain S-box-containing protein